MRVFLISALAASGILLTSIQSKAEEVLMLTWNGAMFAETVFEKHLRKLRPGVTFKYINAQRKKANLAKVLRSEDLSSYELVYSSGTNGTKIVKTFLNGKKPHVFNIVTAPVSSQIAESIEKPGGNLTGARLLVNVKDQFDLIFKMKKIKDLAIWFDPREKHNTAVLNKIKDITKSRNVNIHLKRLIPDAEGFDNQLKKASEEANDKDALYVVSSYSFYTNAENIHKHLKPELLVINTLKRYVQLGATVAVASDITERSMAVAEQANKILSGTPTDQIPIDIVKPEKIYLYVNKEKMQKAGLSDLKSLSANVEYVKTTKNAQN